MWWVGGRFLYDTVGGKALVVEEVALHVFRFPALTGLTHDDLNEVNVGG